MQIGVESAGYCCIVFVSQQTTLSCIRELLPTYNLRECEDGWEYTNSHWPFGHGYKRHVGASYFLRPGGQSIKAILTMKLPVIIDYGYLATNPNQRTQRSLQEARDRTRNATHRRQLEVARARDRHP